MPRFLSFRCSVIVLALFAICGGSAPAAAQYLRSEQGSLSFLRLSDPQDRALRHLLLPESERPGIDIAARMAERWRRRLERLLEHELRGRQPLVLYASHPDFEQTNVIGGEIGRRHGRRDRTGQAAHRAAAGRSSRGHRSRDRPRARARVSVRHDDAARQRRPDESGVERLPLWFIEGMAEYLSIGPVDPNTAMWLRDAARREKLPTIKDLNNPKYFPYRWGQALWAYIGGRWGDEVIRDSCCSRRAAGDSNAAFEHVLGVTTKEFSTDWHAAIQLTYGRSCSRRRRRSDRQADDQGQELGGELNVGPSISPDGTLDRVPVRREASFRSTLYLADAATGKIVRKLTSTATDPHFSSIQFIYSAGAWDQRQPADRRGHRGRRAAPRWRSTTRRKATRERARSLCRTSKRS